LSGSLYSDGVPIYPEEKLEALILDEKIQQVIVVNKLDSAPSAVYSKSWKTSRKQTRTPP
jgi:hypothetical protein